MRSRMWEIWATSSLSFYEAQKFPQVRHSLIRRSDLIFVIYIILCIVLSYFIVLYFYSLWCTLLLYPALRGVSRDKDLWHHISLYFSHSLTYYTYLQSFYPVLIMVNSHIIFRSSSLPSFTSFLFLTFSTPAYFLSHLFNLTILTSFPFPPTILTSFPFSPL